VIRAAVVAVAAASLVAIAIPMAKTAFVRESQQDAGGAALSAALSDARDAESVEPFAARPRLQQALVLELSGDLDEAAAAARDATREDPDNWRNWLVLARLEAERGRAADAVDAYRKARSLNPRSPLFQRGETQ
jgi:cytochrome c-type biogenesis protein CcmH/NrfG